MLLSYIGKGERQQLNSTRESSPFDSYVVPADWVRGEEHQRSHTGEMLCRSLLPV